MGLFRLCGFASLFIRGRSLSGKRRKAVYIIDSRELDGSDHLAGKEHERLKI